MSEPHPEPGHILLGLSAGAAAGQPGHYDYLLLAMAPDKSVRVKPQNLVVGLPLAANAKAA